MWIRQRYGKIAVSIFTTLALLLGLLPATVLADSETAELFEKPESTVTFTFTDSGVTASDESASGFSIDGTELVINAAGVYTVTGSCSDGTIAVKKSTTGVTLILEDLTLACSFSAPLVCRKSTGVTLYLSGTNVLTDNENPEDENSDDEKVADAFEGAAIKVKSDSASLTITGDGTLTADGSNCKNGIKAGATSSITVNGGTLMINAANNGLAADGAVIINGGALDIDVDGDGIKASPDDDDTESAGTITISGGDIAINAGDDGINAAGDIAIYGGVFDIDAVSDGIQTDSNLTITNGTFDIKTLNGASGSGFNSDTMSCKGLKASGGSDDDTDETEEAENAIVISGGTFTLDTADDAIHSDAFVNITGGTFAISTGDDGVHADTSLVLGASGGRERDPDITISKSYEGLEAGTIYVYSGRYYVIASDDGINAAGGSGSGSDPGGPGGGGFNPGGGGGAFGPGGRSFGGGGRGFNSGMPMLQSTPHDSAGANMSRDSAGMNQNSAKFTDSAKLMNSTTYSLNISGGKTYVKATGDGLDSNGPITITGGEVEVWGQASSGNNDALDCDGTLTINGGTVFASGGIGVDGVPSPSGGQTGLYYPSTISAGSGRGGMGGTSSIASGTIFTVSNGSQTLYQTQSEQTGAYAFYTSPNLTSSYSISASTSGSVNCLYGNSWAHSWNDGEITTAATETESGVMTYTCSVCGETETRTIPATGSNDSGEEDENDPAYYTVTFSTDGNCTINVYHTQDYTTASETNVTSARSRDGDTGEEDASGSGQVNFVIVPADGYEVDEINLTPTDTYKQIKGPDSTGQANTYRITKITGDLTVSITMKAAESETGGNTVTVDGTSAAISVDFSDQGISAGAYTLIAAFYDEDNKMLYANVISPITLDSTLSVFVSGLICPEAFDNCEAFLLDGNTCPACESVSLSVVTE